jgi:nucleotide-binding universal stress UspA family protein
MYRTILVTVDGTPGAQNVVLAAKTCATALGAELIELPIDSSRPADESILAEADARQAHLLVMAAAERLPDHVLAHARMPVMLIRPTDFRMEQLKLILVPTDGSPGAPRAQRWSCCASYDRYRCGSMIPR